VWSYIRYSRLELTVKDVLYLVSGVFCRSVCYDYRQMTVTKTEACQQKAVTDRRPFGQTFGETSTHHQGHTIYVLTTS